MPPKRPKDKPCWKAVEGTLMLHAQMCPTCQTIWGRYDGGPSMRNHPAKCELIGTPPGQRGGGQPEREDRECFERDFLTTTPPADDTRAAHQHRQGGSCGCSTFGTTKKAVKALLCGACAAGGGETPYALTTGRVSNSGQFEDMDHRKQKGALFTFSAAVQGIACAMQADDAPGLLDAHARAGGGAVLAKAREQFSKVRQRQIETAGTPSARKGLLAPNCSRSTRGTSELLNSAAELRRELSVAAGAVAAAAGAGVLQEMGKADVKAMKGKTPIDRRPEMSKYAAQQCAVRKWEVEAQLGTGETVRVLLHGDSRRLPLTAVLCAPDLLQRVGGGAAARQVAGGRQASAAVQVRAAEGAAGRRAAVGASAERRVLPAVRVRPAGCRATERVSSG
jgi:hypothetical protein